MNLVMLLARHDKAFAASGIELVRDLFLAASANERSQEHFRLQPVEEPAPPQCVTIDDLGLVWLDGGSAALSDPRRSGFPLVAPDCCLVSDALKPSALRQKVTRLTTSRIAPNPKSARDLCSQACLRHATSPLMRSSRASCRRSSPGVSAESAAAMSSGLRLRR